MQRLFGSEISNLVFHFRDYILHKYQVELEIREEQTEYGIMLNVYIDPTHSHFSHIQQECQTFLANPFEPRYEQASWETGKINISVQTKIQSKCSLDVWRRKKFTVFITALCLCIYGLQILGFEHSILLFSHYPESLSDKSELWRYFSHSWVHLSPWHIMFNLTWWWIFAGEIEQKLGSISLIILYLFSAFISGFAQNIASGPVFFGLSGVVYAVLGYVLILDKFSHQRCFNLPQGFFTMLIVGIAFGFVSPLIGVSMGNTAHITGLVTGIILAFLTIFLTKKER